MAFVPGFLNDVFVSYAHADNETRWVSAFVQDLKLRVNERLGGRDEFRLFLDTARLEAGHRVDALREEVRSSAILLSILSPSYVSGRWTMEEFGAFHDGTREAGRAILVERLPAAQVSYPALAGEVLCPRFYVEDRDTGGSRILSRQVQKGAYLREIDRLAEHVKKRLLELRVAAGRSGAEAATSGPAWEAASIPAEVPGPVETPAAEDGRPVVLLGRVTDDLGLDRDQVRSYLEQFGVRTVPFDDYPDGGVEFRRRFQDDLDALAPVSAKLFVQLVGPHASRRPAALPEGYERHQIEAARAAGVPVLHWRKRNFDAEAIADPLQRALALDAVAGTLEELKASARALCEPPPPASAAPPGRVFLNSDQSDLPLAHTLMDALFENDFTAVVPQFDEDMRRDIDDNIRACSALVFVYGNVHPRWLRQQLLHAESLLPERKGNPPIVRIFNAPPMPKDDPGVRLRGCREVTSLDALISELRA